MELSLDTHGVAEDIGAGLIAAKLRASKEKESVLLKSETEEETAKRMANEMKKVTSKRMNAVKFPRLFRRNRNEKQRTGRRRARRTRRRKK